MAEDLPQQLDHLQVNAAKCLGRFALRTEDTPWPQDPAAVLKEAAVEQAFGGAGGIRAIHQHDVVAGIGSGGGPRDSVPDA